MMTSTQEMMDELGLRITDELNLGQEVMPCDTKVVEEFHGEISYKKLVKLSSKLKNALEEIQRKKVF